MEGESGLTGSIMYEFHSLDIKEYQMAGESWFARSNIDEVHSSDIQGDRMER